MKTIQGKVVKEYFRRGTFMIGLFRANSRILLPSGFKKEFFKVKGNFEKIVGTDMEITGSWEAKSAKTKDPVFIFGSASLLRREDRAGAVAYLKSLRGVGDVTARKIYGTFGSDVFRILDANPERLLEIKGISGKKADRIIADYIARTKAKELFACLYGYRMDENSIRKIWDIYGAGGLDKATRHPHLLFLESLLPFKVAEKIAKDEGLDPLCEERIKAAVLRELQKSELEGDTYTPLKTLSESVCRLLDITESPEAVKEGLSAIFAGIKEMAGKKLEIETRGEDRLLYTKEAYEAEHSIAENLARLAREGPAHNDFSSLIEESQKKLGLYLSEEQRAAVASVLSNPVTVVTGGPGTGKTTFLSVLLDVFKTLRRGGGKIVLGAPTGRAARRMTQQTGMTSRTLHSILKISVDDEGEVRKIPAKENDFQTANLIVIDEVSMLDIFLARKVFESVRKGCGVVLIGDIRQLPSVGAGDVLKSLIDSGCFPVCYFTKIFRQGEGSSIVENAAKISKGQTDIEFDKDFEILERASEDIPDTLTGGLYEELVKEYGIDEVAVLTPFRRRTATGVNGLNPRLKGVYNPYVPASPEEKLTGLDIYRGDRVMFTRNEGDLANGDIGTLKKIRSEDGEQYADILFDDGKKASLLGDSLKALVPAFATTIHKAQGSEYRCVVLVIDSAHDVLLRRNLIYTGITRAKEKIVIIGQRKALNEGIIQENAEVRKTRLSELIGESRE